MAKRLVDRLGPTRACGISFDSYYRDLAHLRVEQRAQVNFDHPDSLDHRLLIEHLELLRDNQTIAVPEYDFATHTRSGGLTLVEPKRFVILEGILLFAFGEVRDLLDHRIFRQVDTGVRAERRLARDVNERGRSRESVMRQWNETVQPMHDRYVEPFVAHADVVTTADSDLEDVVEQISKELLSLNADAET